MAERQPSSRFKIKRAYEPAMLQDGTRILVDRVWPRGVSKEMLACEMWLKDIAPSTELRKWFNHDVDRWASFQQRYLAELDNKAHELETILAIEGTVTLVFGAKDLQHNQAVVLQQLLERMD